MTGGLRQPAQYFAETGSGQHRQQGEQQDAGEEGRRTAEEGAVEVAAQGAADQPLAELTEALRQAQMQVDEGLSGLDGDQSLSDVPQEQQQAIEQLESSYQELNSTLGCS